MALRLSSLHSAARFDVTVTNMRRLHLPAVLGIETQVYPQPWTRALFVNELGMRTTRAYHVARIGRGVVGYSGLMFIGDECHVTNIAVNPSWQGREIGTRLMLNAIEVAIQRGARHMTLEVRVTNSAAQALYRKFGFAPVGVRKNYYRESNEDALIMWTDDLTGSEYVGRIARLRDGLGAPTNRNSN